MVNVAKPIRPMKAVNGELPTGDGWVFELKWDGMRVLGHLDDTTTLRSANEIDISHRFPELENLHEALGATAVLDGEVVALDEHGHPSFSRLQHRMHVGDRAEAVRRAADVPVGYQVFDLLHLDGHDLTGLALADRRRLLEQLVEPGAAWRVTEQFTDGPALLSHAGAHQLEGIVAKRLDSPYLAGRRARTWRKIKIRLEQEFVVAGYTRGEGGRGGSIGALVLGYWDGDELRCAGRVGTGFTAAELATLAAALAPLRVDGDPFRPPLAGPEARLVQFVRPEMVVQVGFAEWSADRRLRHPTYLGRRDDVDPGSVGVEP
ncbi:MAG: non-homologous end-joining DNA ligase [Acidimicrobiales bacterium]